MVSRSQVARLAAQTGQRVLVSDKPDDPDCVDYTLVPPHDRVWIRVGKIAVHIVKTGEGVIVDLWADGHENESLATCGATFVEAQEAADDQEIKA
jgi:hypothetical protein